MFFLWLNAALEDKKSQSMDCRKRCSYWEEKKVVEDAVKCFPHDPYFKRRMQWHQKPLAGKLKARPPINVSFNERKPKAETLQNLCIVTGGDAAYFDMILETIQSIKQLPRYKNIPLIVLDGGLKKEHIDYFHSHFKNVTVKNPDWCIKVSPGTPSYMKCMALRPFFPTILPGHGYYLWMDSDIWVQSEHVLDRYVCMAEDQGFAMCAESKRLYHFTHYTCLSWKDWLPIMWKTHLNVGLFCVDANGSFQKEWDAYARQVFAQNGPDMFEKYGIKMFDQHTANYLVYKHHMKYLQGKENYCLRLYGIPIVSGRDDILRDPETFEPVGAIHLVHNKTARTPNNPMYYVPTRVSSVPLKGLDLFWHKCITRLYHHFRPEQLSFLSKGKQHVSWRFPVIKDD